MGSCKCSIATLAYLPHSFSITSLPMGSHPRRHSQDFLPPHGDAHNSTGDHRGVICGKWQDLGPDEQLDSFRKLMFEWQRLVIWINTVKGISLGKIIVLSFVFFIPTKYHATGTTVL